MVAGVPNPVDEGQLRDFCQRWHIVEMALFGSHASGAPRADSDIDVLVSYEAGKRPTLEEWLDLVEKERLVNPFRRHEILRTARVVYCLNSTTCIQS